MIFIQHFFSTHLKIIIMTFLFLIFKHCVNITTLHNAEMPTIRIKGIQYFRYKPSFVIVQHNVCIQVIINSSSKLFCTAREQGCWFLVQKPIKYLSFLIQGHSKGASLLILATLPPEHCRH